MQELNSITDLREGRLVRIKAKPGTYSPYSHHVVRIIKVDGDYALIEFVKTVILTGSVGFRTEIVIHDFIFSEPSEEYLQEFMDEDWPNDIE